MKKAAVFFLLLTALMPLPALAYVGPGLGLSAIMSLLAFAGAIFVSVFSFFWLPLKRLLKGRKKTSGEPAENNDKPSKEDNTRD
jgi:hypothetical protein